MEHRNNVHKYQTYFQARLVYPYCRVGQQLLLPQAVKQDLFFQ